MNKFNFTKEQKRNLVIALVIVVLLIAGIIYAEMNRRSAGEGGINAPVLDENNENRENSENANTEESAGEEPAPTVDTGDVKITDTNKAKFDLALKQGSEAFLAGNYAQAIVYYNQALTYKNSDVVYIRIFTVYNVQGNIAEAIKAIDTAIKLNPKYTDYWNTKIAYLDEKTSASYAELKVVYTAGLAKVDPKTKINLVTSFARVSETNGQITDAISLWEYAKNLYPQNSALYQAEIDRLKSL
ncbi:MAG: tetratricopeptide repeat protein [Candidatus Paceibacterota bacterium]